MPISTKPRGRVRRKIRNLTSKESKPLDKKNIFPFLSLPRELRDIIYAYSLDWNDGARKLEEWLAESSNATLRPIWIQLMDKMHIKDVSGQPYTRPPQKSTPNILLLNRQITNEALYHLRKTPLELRLVPFTEVRWYVYLRMQRVFMPTPKKWSTSPLKSVISRFISKETLSHVPHLRLHLDLPWVDTRFHAKGIVFGDDYNEEWTAFLGALLDILAPKDAEAPHRLKTLEFVESGRAHYTEERRQASGIRTRIVDDHDQDDWLTPQTRTIADYLVRRQVAMMGIECEKLVLKMEFFDGPDESQILGALEGALLVQSPSLPPPMVGDNCAVL